jgi:transcriptional regulator with PAS, ATPase and Fis domain
VSSYDYPVHIFGETGTGKELVAKAIHNESRRKDHPFIPINCGALPSELIESELFGHEKGAFTGAVREKRGRFELAEGGTLFLDEITDLPKPVQVKLLRCLQEGMIEKVGSEKSIKTNVRIISASNLDLKNEVVNNHFREDLYYRLNVIPIEVPPLRSRTNDIPLLCNHFLEKIYLENKDVRHTLSKEALTAIMDHDWPGNVRELENAIKYAVVKCQSDTIQLADLPKEVSRIRGSIDRFGIPNKLQKQAVIDALRDSKGSKVKAAKLLGVGRATLYRYFERHPEEQEAYLK